LQEHETKTVPVIDKYKQLHGVSKIDGLGSFDEVFERISLEIGNGFKSMR
jgi:adenylate kinase